MCVRACVFFCVHASVCALVRSYPCLCLHVRPCACLYRCVRACICACLCVLLACVRAPHSLDSFPSHCECDVGACGCAYRRQTARWTARMSARICCRSLRCLPAGTARTSATTCSSSPRTSRYVVRSQANQRRALRCLHCTPLHSTALHSAVTNTPDPPNCASVLLYRVGLCACVRRSSCGGTRAEAAVCG